jgi:hypothetical protein
MTANYFHRTVGVQSHGFRDASQQEPVDAAPAMRTYHNQVRLPFRGFAQDQLLGGGGRNCNRTAGFEACFAQIFSAEETAACARPMSLPRSCSINSELK